MHRVREVNWFFKNLNHQPPQTSWFATMSFSVHFCLENNFPLWSTRTVIPTSAMHVRIFVDRQAGQESIVLKIIKTHFFFVESKKIFSFYIIGTSLNRDVSAKAFANGIKPRSSKGSSPEKGTTAMALELSSNRSTPPKSVF